MAQGSRLDFKRRITTKAGSDVRIYEVFEGRYINGAVYEPVDDVWWPYQWDANGNYAFKPSSLDLKNGK